MEYAINVVFLPYRVVEFFTYMSLGTHFTACVWFMLACASLTTGPYNPHVCEVESWALQYSHTPLCNSMQYA